MTKKATVALHGFQKRGVQIDLDATDGATVGDNLYWPDGTLITEAELRSGTTVATPTGEVQVAVTLWSLILNIPAFIKSLAALTTTGFVVRTSTAGGTALSRELLGESGRIVVADGDGVAGDPTIDLDTLADSGTGVLRVITRDTYGRVSGSVARTITGESGRIVVADGTGAAANPTVTLGPWPTVKNSVEVGEVAVIPEGHQMLVSDVFVFDGGTLTMDGDLIVL